MRGLMIVTFVVVMTVIVMVWWGLGRFSKKREQTFLTPEYLAKREQVSSLRHIAKARPLTNDELNLLRQFAQDPDWRIRFRALTIFRELKGHQRREAIQIARERLKDETWVVRIIAMRTLASFQAKEAAADILPLLNDPEPEVRKEARKTLQQLGYKVGE